ncbi:MAG: C69 family dipeptidase [Caulobacteraceae bacterium]|nr:C69 family dipeptidase [Caulobacteraceae bacterium]
MCDTLAALAGETLRGAVLFAKNSDRERNEAQFLELAPRGRHAPGSALKATYVTIPQVAETHACLLSRPFWMWGAEMGANEHGVVIGNEAMHARLPAQRRRALIGMDLVRLGLERGSSAAEAVEVITGLLEAHGQGGDCGHLGRFYYHNGFIVADAREAYVLETVGRWWIVERVADVRALSNAFSIGEGYARASAGLLAHARAEGWCDAAGRFDFAGRMIDEARDAASFGRGRCARGTELLNRRRGALTPADMMAILRDHGPEGEGDPDWTPADTARRTICMHAAQGPRRSQSVASMVSELKPAGAVHWVTGTSAPCLSLFKPVLFETGLPDQGPRPTDAYDGESLWWRHERLHRAALADFAGALAAIAPERDALEAGFRVRVDHALASGDPQARRRAVAACWREAEAAETRWRAALASRGLPAGGLGRSWARLGHVAAMPKL